MGRIICGLDLETTGLDHEKDQITEIGWVIRDTDDPKPLLMRTFFVRPTYMEGFKISEENYALTKISEKHLEKHGFSLDAVLLSLTKDLFQNNVDAIVAHNGAYFDRPFLLKKLAQHSCPESYLEALNGPLWIDTYTDCEYPKDCRSTNLTYLAAYYGFLNPFPHAALMDVMTMLRVLSHFDIEAVMDRARSPWVAVRADVSFADRELAKARRYSWEKLGDVVYPKQWVKRLRQMDVAKERAEAGFPIYELY